MKRFQGAASAWNGPSVTAPVHCKKSNLTHAGYFLLIGIKAWTTGLDLPGRAASRIFFGAVVAVVPLVATGAAFEAISWRDAAGTFPPHGKLNDIGRRRIYIDFVGSGPPSGIPEVGADITGSTLSFPMVRAVAQITRACSYDRAGQITGGSVRVVFISSRNLSYTQPFN